MRKIKKHAFIVRPTSMNSFRPGSAPRKYRGVSVFLTCSYPRGTCRASYFAVAEAPDDTSNEPPEKPPGSSRSIRGSDTSEPPGKTTGPSRTI